MKTRQLTVTTTDLGSFRLMREITRDIEHAMREPALQRRIEMLIAIGDWLERVARIWPELADFDLWFAQVDRKINETGARIDEQLADGDGWKSSA